MKEQDNVLILNRGGADTPARIDQRNYADAFMALEPDICDLVRAAELAWLANESENQELTTFGLEQFEKAAKALKARYYELWPKPAE